MGGFASPPQQDLALASHLTTEGVYAQATYKRLESSDCAGVDELRKH